MCFHKIIRLSLFTIAVLISHAASAFVVDLNALYYTDTTTAAQDTSHKSTLFDLLIGFDIDKKGNYQVGWDYASHTTETVDNTTTISYKSTQMGPGFIFYVDKDRAFRFGFSYNLKTTAKYTQGVLPEEEWRGTAMNANFGYQFRFDSVTSLGLRLNYSTTSYYEKVITTVKTDTSYKKVMIFPTIAFTLDSF